MPTPKQVANLKAAFAEHDIPWPTMSKHYVGISDPRLIYVILEDRVEFDKIGLPVQNAENERGGQVISKTVKGNGVMVVFQHWIGQPQRPGDDA